MNALREVREISANTLTIDIPKAFRYRKVEVIVLPFEDTPVEKAPQRRAKGWPRDYFSRTAGSFADSQLERAPQGSYETRDELV